MVAEQKHRNLPMLATLKAFLDHDARAAPTARTLGVHVNTLYQRIALLDRLLGPDWRQPPDRWTCTFYCESFQIRSAAGVARRLVWGTRWVRGQGLGSLGRRPVRTRRRIAGVGVLASGQGHPLLAGCRLLRRREVT